MTAVSNLDDASTSTPDVREVIAAYLQLDADGRRDLALTAAELLAEQNGDTE